MYNARLHPEQYSDTFSDAQLSQLHKSVMYVCKTAVDTLADSEQFPDEWLFKHRWSKGKKDVKMELPNGAKITFLTVGGRTSCVVPSVQKKTGAVAGDVKAEDEEDKPAKGGKAKKSKKDFVDDEEEVKDEVAEEDAKPASKKRKSETTQNETKEKAATVVDKDEAKIKDEEVPDAKPSPKSKKRRAEQVPKEAKKTKPNGDVKDEGKAPDVNRTGRRRSGRVSGKA